MEGIMRLVLVIVLAQLAKSGSIGYIELDWVGID